MTLPAKLPLDSLRAFESAARHGSFVRAGDELNVTAAAISHRVKDLEAALGIPLFIRKSRGIALTEAGRRFHASIADALKIIERAAAHIEESSVAGPLTVSAPEAFADLWLIPRLPGLTAAIPGLELAIEADNRVSSLREGPADIAIRFGAGDYPDLDCEFLCGDAVTVLIEADADSRRADSRPATIMRDGILLHDYRVSAREPWMTWPPWIREAGLGPRIDNPKLGFSNSGMALHACSINVGLCIGRMSLAFDLVRKRRLKPLFPWRSTEMAYYLVMPPAAKENPRVLAFRGWLVEELTRYTRDVASELGIELPLPATRT